ncbi:alkaline phosphatase D family protein [Pseudomonas brassicacearum]|uniref:alkaline phosphatase D family protein n=1 Tax=Pseudomonas brassicacearum TaxID=930166 RepID=UPI001294C2C5|nr:alkaline phosphatase D family protein [Pseudomonas brassicacearum]QGA48447.1 alkaline phosphatase D family protein [Pseudomonas brassicacearum]
MALVDPRNNEYDVSKLQSASIIGHVTTQSARIWIRVYTPGNWSLVWSKKAIEGDLVKLDGKPLAEFLKPYNCAHDSYAFSWEDDLTHTFDLQGLDQDTTYFYYLMTDETDGTDTFRRTEIGCHKSLAFRTMADEMLDFSFGFYSCHDPFNANGSYGAWPLFLEKMDVSNARFAIGGGDQVYVDCQESKHFPDIWEWLKDNKDDLIAECSTKGKLDLKKLDAYLLNLYRWYYRVYWKFPHLQEAFSKYPQYMMWDDHEIMDGWGSRTDEERIAIISRYFERDDKVIDRKLVNSMWMAARTAYFEYAHSHNPETGVSKGSLKKPETCIWDYGFEKGGIPFYMLDMRGHHDVETPEKKNFLLGTKQIERFQEWLKSSVNSSSPLLFVVSPVPFVHWKSVLLTAGSWLDSAKDDCMDEWDHSSNHAERNILLDSIFPALDKSGKTLVFISGDVHCAAAFRLSHDKYRKASIYQVTSSAISRMPAGQFAGTGIANSGKINGHDSIYFEHLFSHSEDKNFAIFHVAGGASASVDLCWPGGSQGEAVVKTLRLR